MPAGVPASDAVVIVDGVRLAAPRREGDCACTFCSTFRTKHLIWRAVLMTLTLVPAVAFTRYVWNAAAEDPQGGGNAAVGGLLIAVTLLTALAVATWYQPARRLVHFRRPRTTAWPP